jgi:hypothetical protein
MLVFCPNGFRGVREDQGCSKLSGPRTVPVRSSPDGSRMFWFFEHPDVFLRAANRDGSRSDPELDALLRESSAPQLLLA